MADYLNNFSLEGKVALITGASYGIGFASQKQWQELALPSYLTISSRNW